MDAAGVAVALGKAAEDEEGLLATEQERRLHHNQDQDMQEEGVPCCHRCRLPVRQAGFLREDATINGEGSGKSDSSTASPSFTSPLLAVWWCDECGIAFDGAGIRAPETGRAPLVPGYLWYGRWRFHPTPGSPPALNPSALNTSEEDTLNAAEAAARECAHLLSLARSAAQAGDHRDQARRLRQFQKHLAQLTELTERFNSSDTDLK